MRVDDFCVIPERDALNADIFKMPALICWLPRWSLTLLQMILLSRANDILNPNGPRSRIKGRFGMNDGSTFESKHSANHSSFFFSEIVIANRSPNAFVLDLYSTGCSAVSVCQPNVNIGVAKIGGFIRTVFTIISSVAQKIKRNTIAVRTLPFLKYLLKNIFIFRFFYYLILMTLFLIELANDSGPFMVWAIADGPRIKSAV